MLLKVDNKTQREANEMSACPFLRANGKKKEWKFQTAKTPCRNETTTTMWRSGKRGVVRGEVRGEMRMRVSECVAML